MGVIGFGNIGSIVASLAQGLKMNVIIFDPNVTAEPIQKAGFESVSLEELREILNQLVEKKLITFHVDLVE